MSGRWKRIDRPPYPVKFVPENEICEVNERTVLLQEMQDSISS